MPEAEPFSSADTEARESLEELGLPEWLTGSLTQEELSLCEGALWAKDCGIETRGDTALDGGLLEMEVWAVGLADRQVALLRRLPLAGAPALPPAGGPGP